MPPQQQLLLEGGTLNFQNILLILLPAYLQQLNLSPNSLHFRAFELG
jgi:hypothetical protein